jgi:hypothetical protein
MVGSVFLSGSSWRGFLEIKRGIWKEEFAFSVLVDTSLLYFVLFFSNDLSKHFALSFQVHLCAEGPLVSR